MNVDESTSGLGRKFGINNKLVKENSLSWNGS
jgi:hypothetical protein